MGRVEQYHTHTYDAVLLAACCPITKYTDATDAEAKAALIGIRLLTNLGHDRVILEMDCTTAVAALRSSSLDRSLQWATYDEAKKLLRNVGDHRLSHKKRESNRELHLVEPIS
jgi:ribonuclease HI